MLEFFNSSTKNICFLCLSVHVCVCERERAGGFGGEAKPKAKSYFT